ncbi:hypothetical protein [Clostridium intestinale]|uniref:Uncharacterized protein n=1 Tax=Clostridium intestinale TaxID=36845 RepID=A0A7D6W2Q1_9CLOT|nr:hypothetical protein [Clostridium intestinale]QLY81311.1 hypothetical protein HZF06_06945 [Clostridium intestinale]
MMEKAMFTQTELLNICRAQEYINNMKRNGYNVEISELVDKEISNNIDRLSTRDREVLFSEIDKIVNEIKDYSFVDPEAYKDYVQDITSVKNDIQSSYINDMQELVKQHLSDYIGS